MKQEQVFAFVKTFWKQHHYSPTYAEIGKPLSIHQGTVRNHLIYLQAKGWLTFNPGESRSIIIKEN
jgi:predicted ArsR family transcriptional regulator